MIEILQFLTKKLSLVYRVRSFSGLIINNSESMLIKPK